MAFDDSTRLHPRSQLGAAVEKAAECAVHRRQRGRRERELRAGKQTPADLKLPAQLSDVTIDADLDGRLNGELAESPAHDSNIGRQQ